MSNDSDNGRLLFVMENFSKEISGMRKDILEVLVCVGSFKERMDNIEKRVNDHEKRLRANDSSLSSLEFEANRRSDMKKGIGFPIANAVVIAVIFAIFGAGAGITVIHLNELQKTGIERSSRN